MALAKTDIDFHVNAPVKGIMPIVGGDPVFIRDSAAFLVGQQDLVRSLVRTQYRIEVMPIPVVGFKPSAALLLELARTNKNIWSKDLTQWTQGGTCSITTGQPDASGGLTGQLANSSASGSSRATIINTFSGNGVKAGSIRLKKGTAALSEFGIYDNGAATWRHGLRATWSATGVPTVTTFAGAGSFWSRRLYDGYWLISYTANGIISANQNVNYLFPAGGSGTGTVYFGGMYTEDATYPTSPPADTTGAVPTRSVERLYWRSAVPASRSVVGFGSFIYGGDRDSTPYRCLVGKGDGTGAYFGVKHTAADALSLESYNGTTTGTLNVTIPATLARGDLVEYYFHINTGQDAAIAVQKNRGTLVTNSSTNGFPTLPANWGGFPDVRTILNGTGAGLDGATHYIRLMLVNPANMTYDPQTLFAEAMQELQRFAQTPNGEVILGV